MNDTGVIDQFLDVFTRYIDSGFGLLGGEVAFIASTLVVIDITLAALFWAWGPSDDVIARLVKKTLFVGFFAFLIGNFNSLANIVFQSFSGLGLKASGSTMSNADFLRPGVLAQAGIDAGRPMLESASQMSGFPGFFENFVQIAILMIAFVVVVLAFFVLAIMLGALSLLGLGIFGPGIATGLVSGAPQLGAGAAIGTGLAVGGVAMAGAAGARLAVGGGAGLAGRAGGAVAATRGSPGGGSASSLGGSPNGAPPSGRPPSTGQGGEPSSPGGGPANTRTGSASASPLASASSGAGPAPRPGDGASPEGATTRQSVQQPASSDRPAWAREMARRQAVGHGVQTALQAVRSGDRGGGTASVSVSEDRT